MGVSASPAAAEALGGPGLRRFLLRRSHLKRGLLKSDFGQQVFLQTLGNRLLFIVVDAQGRLANAVVILSGVKRSAAAEATVMNEKCRFLPRVQLIAPKASITTTSKDPVLHTTNAQLENGRSLFNVALPMPGITITKAISAASNVRLSCSTHLWMRGWMVVTNEAAAISGADGRFTIDNVPPGTYELRVWHEALKGTPQKVSVVSGKPTELSIALQ